MLSSQPHMDSMPSAVRALPQVGGPGESLLRPWQVGSSVPTFPREGQDKRDTLCQKKKKTFSQTSESNEGNEEFRSEKKKAERKDSSTKAASLVKTATLLTQHLRSKVLMGLGHRNGASKCITVWA